MRSGFQNLLRCGACLAGLCLLSGCADGPFYQLYYQKQWQADEKYGPTFHTKRKDLKQLREGAELLSADEQTRYALEINRALADDPSPTYRRDMVQTLATFSVPEARDGLRLAVKDSEMAVRVAACEAWGQIEDAESIAVLGDRIANDEDHDVRMAAARELANFSDPEAIKSLGVALDDSNPALQHRAVQSLKSITGKDFGESVPAWRAYVKGETPTPVKPPSLVQRFRELF